MSFLIGTLSFLMLAVSLFMILLVLIQRGRGGGLAGAFGGMGGQSAFGTRAGDTFTRITIVLAVIWVLLAGGLGMMMRNDAEAAKTGKDDGPFSEGSAADKQDDAADNKSSGDAASDGAASDGAKSDDSKSSGTPGSKDGEQPKAPDVVPADAGKQVEAAEKKPDNAEVPSSEATTPTPEAEKGDAAAEAPAKSEEPAKTEEPATATPADEKPSAEPTP